MRRSLTPQTILPGVDLGDLSGGPASGGGEVRIIVERADGLDVLLTRQQISEQVRPLAVGLFTATRPGDRVLPRG